MKKVLISAAALLAAAAALPAAAQGYGQAYGHPYAQPYAHPYGQVQGHAYAQQGRWVPVHVRLQRLDNRIERGVERGALTRREAHSLRQEFHSLVRLERHYGRDGLSYGERADLERRLDRLAQRVRFERRDDDRRYDDRRYDDRRYDDRRHDDRRYDDRRDDRRRDRWDD
jgi:hypothetical protein